jgi:hypothetical protein
VSIQKIEPVSILLILTLHNPSKYKPLTTAWAPGKGRIRLKVAKLSKNQNRVPKSI